MSEETSSSVTVAITGPSGTALLVGNTEPQGNNVFRRTLAFGGVVPADSGEYTCSVVVEGVTESISAVLDGSGKSSCCIDVGILYQKLQEECIPMKEVPPPPPPPPHPPPLHKLSLTNLEPPL